MGWLEVLALLKRVLPLLNRVAPMLETFLAARGNRPGNDASLERLADDIRGQLAASGQKQDGLADVLTAQASQIATLAEGIARLRASNDRNAACLLEIETSIAAVARNVRTAAMVLAILLTACLGLLVALLLKHSA